MEEMRKYVGSRYVPIFADWSISNTYEPLTIVLAENGNSYTSKQYVPAGIELTDTDYWALTGNYNAQIEEYRQNTTANINALGAKLPSTSFDSENTVEDAIDYVASLLPANEFDSNNTVKDAIDDVSDDITSEASTRSAGDIELQAAIDVLDARMDTFSALTEGSTSGDAELADIRVAYNGVTYNTAGDAVRAQAGGNAKVINGYFDLSASLADNSGIGQWWNEEYPIIIPANTKMHFVFDGYTGNNWTRILIQGIKSDDTKVDIITLYGNYAVEFTQVNTVAFKGIYVQMVRSAAENEVSYGLHLRFPVENMVSGDISNLIGDGKNISGRLSELEEKFSSSISCQLNLLEFATKTNNKIYDRNTRPFPTIGDNNTVHIYEPIRVFSGITYYAYEVYCWFTKIVYDDGEVAYITDSASVYSATFTPTKNGYIYVTCDNNALGKSILTTSEAMYNAHTYNSNGNLNRIGNAPHVFHVEKDGSGDYTSLVTAIEAAEEYMDSTVYVGDGTWDILDELGELYVQSVDSTKRGIVLKNRIHLIFSSNAVVTAMYEGYSGVMMDDTIRWLSVFNSGEYGFTLENCKIVSRNIRYAIHDERSGSTDQYRNEYINCNIQHSNQPYSGSQNVIGFAQCIGGGLGDDGEILICGCIFDNPYQYSKDEQGRKHLVTYHNNNNISAAGRSNIDINGCYFKDEGMVSFGYYGTNEAVSSALVHDNKMGFAPAIGGETAEQTTVNIEMFAWNNVIE